MELVNYTPFPHLAFESRTKEDVPLGVLLVRGTFAVRPDEPLRPLPQQDPVALRDQLRGAPGRSSLIAEADLAPFKPCTDIIVNAIARAPRGEAETEWPVRVRLGRLTKDLMIHGPAVWQHFAVGGWRKTRPVRCREVPLIYENAFGGSYETAEGIVADERNPAGTGYIHAKATPRDRDLAAPQILAIGEPNHLPGEHYVPQGTLHLPPRWQPRLARAGTFDEAWIAERRPRLPLDFDLGFYNSAHPDLIYPGYVQPGALCELVHLTAGREVLSFRLPSYELFGLLRKKSGELRPFPMALDTVHIDVASAHDEEHRAHLVWRGTYWKKGDERRIEARLVDGPAGASHTIAIAEPAEVSHGR